jgi:uncharacterized RDD family membrane protein YckC
MTGPGQPTDPAGGTPNQEPATTPPAAPPPATPPPATPPPASDATGALPPPASESATPPPPPAAPSTPPASASGDLGKEEKPPEWVGQAQNWRPAEVAAGPAPGVAYADLTTRIIAYIIDVIILAIASAIVAAVIAAVGFASGGFAGLLLAGVIILILSVVGGLIYFVYTWTNMRASPGQKVLNLQVVSEKDGSTLTQNQAITRYLYMFAPGFVAGLASQYIGGLLGLILSFVGLVWTIYLLYTTANDPKRQGFHDKQAGSVVVKTTPAA